jgi:hypothetical protein
MSFKNNPDTFFQFRLARDLSMTVAELRSKMSSYEYNQWVAFYVYEQDEQNKAVALAQAESNKRR